MLEPLFSTTARICSNMNWEMVKADDCWFFPFVGRNDEHVGLKRHVMKIALIAYFLFVWFGCLFYFILFFLFWWWKGCKGTVGFVLCYRVCFCLQAFFFLNLNCRYRIQLSLLLVTKPLFMCASVYVCVCVCVRISAYRFLLVEHSIIWWCTLLVASQLWS